MPKKIIIATNNAGKLRELQALLQSTDVELISQTELNISSCDESGLTFIENAILKARHASSQSGLPAIADDSGLIVDALHGEPGIKSARYAGSQSSDTANINKLLAALENIPSQQRTARFQCVTIYLRHPHDPAPLIGQGTWEGLIISAPQGENGFGYDPIFWVPTHKCTAAKLPASEKNLISHRAQALHELLIKLRIGIGSGRS